MTAHSKKDCKVRALIKRPKGAFTREERDLARLVGRESFLRNLDEIGCVMIQFEDENGTRSPGYFFDWKNDSVSAYFDEASKVFCLIFGMMLGSSAGAREESTIISPVLCGAGAVLGWASAPQIGAISTNTSYPRYHDKWETSITREEMERLENSAKTSNNRFYNLLLNNCAHHALRCLHEYDIPKPVINTPARLAALFNEHEQGRFQHELGTSLFTKGELQLLFDQHAPDSEAGEITTFTSRLIKGWKQPHPSARE